MKKFKAFRRKLRYLTREIKQERISYGELAALQDLAGKIPQNFILLRQWSGEKEF